MIYLYLFGTCFHFIYVFMIIANNLLTCEWERANQLPEQRRKIYIMSRFENKSSADIAAQLGISSRTVENHLFISRKEIREYIQKCI